MYLVRMIEVGGFGDMLDSVMLYGVSTPVMVFHDADFRMPLKNWHCGA